MSLKRPFVPKSDVKQLFTTTTTTYSTSTEGLHLYHVIKLRDVLKPRSVAAHCPGRAQHFLEATSFFQDEVCKRTCDIQDIYGVFGSDIYYHPACFSKYIKRFENSRGPVKSSIMSTRKELLYSVFEGIYHGLVQDKVYPLSDIHDRCNNLLSTDKVDSRQLKVL